MENLKIRVNSADESKEAQELFLKYGATGSVWLDQSVRYVCIFNGVLVLYDFLPSVEFKRITIDELRGMVNQEQDEPFLTPECTLNDQYAEIEQVRQVEIHGTVKAAQAGGGVDATLTERQSQYGCYEDVAHVTQQILSALRIGNYDELPAPMKESLHMIASKMARIVNGDPEYLDNWHDIGGYAKLIEKLIKGE